MSRPPRGERSAAKRRPKRRAAKTHFFKYQLANNPSRAEENDLKRALQESLEEQHHHLISSKQTAVNGRKGCGRSNNGNNNDIIIISSTNSSDVSTSNNSSYSNGSSIGSISSAVKRTRSSVSALSSANKTISDASPLRKRAKLIPTLEPRQKLSFDGYQHATVEAPLSNAPPPLPHVNKAIRTYSRSQATNNDSSVLGVDNNRQPSVANLKSTTLAIITTKPALENVGRLSLNDKCITPESNRNPNQSSVSKSTQTTSVRSKLKFVSSTPKKDGVTTSNGKYDSPAQSTLNTADTSFKKDNPQTTNDTTTSTDKTSSESTPRTSVQDQYLKFKRESKNYAYVKMTALKVSTSKSPNSISSKSLQNGKAVDSGKAGKKPKNNVQVSQLSRNSIPKQGVDLNPSGQSPKNDCSLEDTVDLSKKKNQNHANVNVIKKRLPQGSWSLLGVPEEKVIYLRDDEPPRRLICYPAIRHVEGDVIQVRSSVLLRSGARKTDLPYIAKVRAFWEDAETGGVMMSLFWYYRPEHTEEGRKPHHLHDEIFASRHRDVDSVECIEDKCYVLTFNEYCRYKKRCKMEQVGTNWSLTDVTIPISNESYPRRDRIPDSDVNPELVFCCRQIYDSRMRRLLKNPLINTKYGHI